MGNDTLFDTTEQPASSSTDTSKLILVYVTWIVEFFVIGLGNFIIAFAVLKYRALRTRKEYIIIFGLSLADAWNLCGYGASGFYRLNLISANQFDELRSSWTCTIMPPSVLWLTGESVAACMLVVVSLDRLCAVSIPLRYMQFGASYAYYLVAAAFGLCLANTFVGLGLGYSVKDEGKMVGAPCFTGQTWRANGDFHATLTMYSAPVFCVLSIIIYATVLIKFYHVNKSVGASKHDDRKRESQRQRRLTITLGWSSLCTLIFNAIPVVIAYSGDFGYLDLSRLTMQILWLLPNINPFCNLIIYYNRQPDLVRGVKAFLACRSMPTSISMWKTAITSNAAPSAGPSGKY